MPLLQAHKIAAGYGKRQVLFDVSIHLEPGEVVGVLGHNGAGKTTLLNAIFGIVPLQGGQVQFDGQVGAGGRHVDRVKAGMSLTPAEAAVFRDLTVGVNLELGAFTVRNRALKRTRLERVSKMFPILAERHKQLAGTLSGGQQRMLSLGVALMTGPRLMLLDEPSLGLAPASAQLVLEEVKRLATEDKVSILLVEQNVRSALRITDRVYFMRSGRIILEETGERALARGKWWDLF